jgi:hypothetical protein
MAIISLPVGGGVLFGGEVLALLQGYPGAQLPGYLPVLHGLPGDGALPAHHLDCYRQIGIHRQCSVDRGASAELEEQSQELGHWSISL